MTVDVLVVDDDRELRETVCALLDYEGFTTVAARDGAEALAYLHAAPPPRVILLDLSMPVMDGIEFRERQCQDPAISAIPVIAFSAAASLPEKLRNLEVNAILKKPIKLAQLLSTIARFCRPADATSHP